MPQHTRDERRRRQRNQRNVRTRSTPPRNNNQSITGRLIGQQLQNPNQSLAPSVQSMQGGGQQQGSQSLAPDVRDFSRQMTRQASGQQGPEIPMSPSVAHDRGLSELREARQAGEWEPGEALPENVRRLREQWGQGREAVSMAPTIEEMQQQQMRQAQIGSTQAEGRARMLEGTGRALAPQLDLAGVRRQAQATESAAETGARAEIGSARERASGQVGAAEAQANRALRLSPGDTAVDPQTGQMIGQGFPIPQEPREPISQDEIDFGAQTVRNRFGIGGDGEGGLQVGEGGEEPNVTRDQIIEEAAAFVENRYPDMSEDEQMRIAQQIIMQFSQE